MDSWPSHDDVGGLFFDFELFRTASGPSRRVRETAVAAMASSRDIVIPRESTRSSGRRQTASSEYDAPRRAWSGSRLKGSRRRGRTTRRRMDIKKCSTGRWGARGYVSWSRARASVELQVVLQFEVCWGRREMLLALRGRVYQRDVVSKSELKTWPRCRDRETHNLTHTQACMVLFYRQN